MREERESEEENVEKKNYSLQLTASLVLLYGALKALHKIAL